VEAVIQKTRRNAAPQIAEPGEPYAPRLCQLINPEPSLCRRSLRASPGIHRRVRSLLLPGLSLTVREFEALVIIGPLSASKDITSIPFDLRDAACRSYRRRRTSVACCFTMRPRNHSRDSARQPRESATI
jgi:hypothetical protein